MMNTMCDSCAKKGACDEKLYMAKTLGAWCGEYVYEGNACAAGKGKGMVTIRTGDALEIMQSMTSESVHCIVTSPPYYGLRDYGVDGQIGLEATPQEYISKMVDVFREARRVLRDDGTMWLNIGDSYAGSKKGSALNPENADNYLQGTSRGMLGAKNTTHVTWGECKPKDLLGIPWMLAFALRADGWYLRQDIIWSKPNPMPESVTDRCTKAHEYIFLLSKSKRYYYDHEAIKEPITESTISRLSQDIENQIGSARVPRKTNGNMKAVGHVDLLVAGSRGAFGPQQSRRRGKGNSKTFRGGGAYTKGQSFDNSSFAIRDSHGNIPNETGKRNKRSVWTVSTTGYRDAHFATFPPNLIRPCILAGCPQKGVVLDMFGGSGTVGVVASECVRDAILIDLNPEYSEMQRRRCGLFAEEMMNV